MSTVNTAVTNTQTPHHSTADQTNTVTSQLPKLNTDK